MAVGAELVKLPTAAVVRPSLACQLALEFMIFDLSSCSCVQKETAEPRVAPPRMP